MADAILSSNDTEGVLTVNGVIALKANQSGVLTAGAAGVSGNDLATVGQTIGVGQTWQDVTGSRALSTTYTNSTGKPIMVSGWGTNSSGAAQLSVTVGGVIIWDNFPASTGAPKVPFVAIVPNGATYSVTGSGLTLTKWTELR